MSRCWMSVLVLFAACDPAFVMKGRIVDDRDAPVVGARVELVCNGVDQMRSATTESNGRFRSSDIGVFDDPCTVEVRTNDGVTCSYRLSDICTRRQHGGCTEVTLDASTATCVAPRKR